MITITCRHLESGCTEALAGTNANDIQQAFLAHVHSKHQSRWSELTKMSRAASLVAVRNRYRAEETKMAHGDAAGTAETSGLFS
jgi:hypothetical protein